MDTLYQQLQTKPFVKLCNISNIDELVEELQGLELTLRPYTVENQGKLTAPLDLDVASLIDRSRDSTAGSMGWNARGHMIDHSIVETDLAQRAPKIMQAIDQLFDRPWITRVKISRLPPNSNMLLHKHAYLAQHNNEVVVHIALQTNSQVLAVVVKDGVQTQHFALGEVWYLNTLYPHKFQNNGLSDRYHLWINLVWTVDQQGTSEKLLRMVQSALS